jgi:hypothetical protein
MFEDSVEEAEKRQKADCESRRVRRGMRKVKFLEDVLAAISKTGMGDGNSHERYEVPEGYPEDGCQEVECEEADDGDLVKDVGDGFGAGIGDECGLVVGEVEDIAGLLSDGECGVMWLRWVDLITGWIVV